MNRSKEIPLLATMLKIIQITRSLVCGSALKQVKLVNQTGSDNTVQVSRKSRAYPNLRDHHGPNYIEFYVG